MERKQFVTDSAYAANAKNDKVIYPFGPPIFQTTLTDEIVQSLLNESKKLSVKDDFNHKLAGNLKYGRSYTFSDQYKTEMEPILKDKVNTFFDMIRMQYKGAVDVEQYKNIKLESLWVNFNKKHDFNPPHDHKGVLSFVIYCSVPQEILENQADTNTPVAGSIVFEYGEKICTFMHHYFKVNPFDNLMLIFPAGLKHYVPPFWTDHTRISVSGNFVL
jgi:hypothetical protein